MPHQVRKMLQAKEGALGAGWPKRERQTATTNGNNHSHLLGFIHLLIH